MSFGCLVAGYGGKGGFCPRFDNDTSGALFVAHGIL